MIDLMNIFMVMQDDGLNDTRDQISDRLDKGQLGTSGTAATPADGNLLEPIKEGGTALTLLTLTSKTLSDKQIKFIYTLPSTGGTSTTLREFELARTGGGTAVLTSYDRIVFTGIPFTKNGIEDIIMTKKYFIKSV